ncbi:hypothetical protein AcW1_007351 [Taiwanofungus camphoratus]|nr:hypothetical protein AcW2_007582 [Antrodia cinnamomea]KAI0920061.1 hypothetical protein AcV7_006061 [Antrodia cinnamomea]KAI0927384.1 hypothetical protein AcV5_007937 [Antrodia cinnamomea]KAI0953026.1 hypothetical protein AcW1_007351 [Antrodia cinnamomea]
MTDYSDVELDLSLPMATLLRLGTAAAHEDIEVSQGAGWLARGELDREEYVRFLMMLWHVYDALERALEQHADHPILHPTYNPTLLFRTTNLSLDISLLLETSESSWRSHPMHRALMESPPLPLTRYITRLESIAESPDPSALLAHAYVRYLGDLSGGQIIRAKVAKAYGLDNGFGTSFYEFKPLGGTGIATIGDMKKIKEWYREGMNAAVGNDQVLKSVILREAIVAFGLNSGLFACLTAPVSPRASDPATPPLGVPDSPVDDVRGTQMAGKVVYQAPDSLEKVYNLSSVIAVVAALSLAHFIMVVGGFTGERGYAKLEAVQQWFGAHR